MGENFYLFRDKLKTEPLDSNRRDQYLAWLFNGLNQSGQQFQQKQDEYQIKISIQSFMVIGLEFAEPTDFDLSCNLCEEWHFDKLGPVATIGGRCYVIFNSTPDERQDDQQKTFKDRAASVLEPVIKAMAQRGLTLLAVISEVHSGFDGIASAYQEVDELIKYRHITGNSQQLIQHSKYNISFDSWYEFGNTYSRFDEVRKFIISVQVGDFANAKSTIINLITNDYSLQYPSLELAKCRLYGIIDGALNAIGLLKGDIDEPFLRELDAATRIVSCRSYVQIKDELTSIFDAIIEYFNSKNKEKHPDWFDETINYIKKHYNDPEMNVSMIAGYFQINAAYYARKFKKYMNVAPLDYIHQLRMISAKELMAKGVSVKNTAGIVGYYNTLTMSRAFKRYEGITPGKYIQNESSEE